MRNIGKTPAQWKEKLRTLKSSWAFTLSCWSDDADELHLIYRHEVLNYLKSRFRELMLETNRTHQ